MRKAVNWDIPLFKIYWDKEDIEAVSGVIRKGMMWTAGPAVKKFEAMIADYVGTKYCVCFNSGTSALHAVLLAYNIGRGDEVIVPSFTFVSTCNAPLFVGAKPVFADIEEDTLGLDPEDVERNISKRTKAIIAVHYGGIPCKMEELREIAEKYGLLMIEDAAEAFGAEIRGRKVGTFGDAGVFSFCQNKIITTGEGGCAVTNSREIYNKFLLLRSHGRCEDGNYFSSNKSPEYIDLGYNFRMSEIVASLGISQIKKVGDIINKRRKMADFFLKKLKEVDRVETILPPEDYFCVYQLFSVRVKEGKRDKLMEYLSKEKIMTKIYFKPVHLTYFYREKLGYRCSLPVTETVSNEILTLPFYPQIARKEVIRIVEGIKRFFVRG